MSEWHLQMAAEAFLKAVLPRDCAHTAIDAGQGKMGMRQAQLRKARGVAAGWPDFILVRQGMFYGIELKGAAGRLSDAQERTFPMIQAAGGQISVCRSVADIERALIHWGFPLRGTTLTAEERDARIVATGEKPRKASAPRAHKPSKRALAFGLRAQAYGGGE